MKVYHFPSFQESNKCLSNIQGPWVQSPGLEKKKKKEQARKTKLIILETISITKIRMIKDMTTDDY